MTTETMNKIEKTRKYVAAFNYGIALMDKDVEPISAFKQAATDCGIVAYTEETSQDLHDFVVWAHAIFVAA